NPDRNLYFKGIKLWNMPMKEIEGRLKEFWISTRKTLRAGVVLEEKPWGKKTRMYNNLPSPGQNGLCHLRPKGRNGADKIQLPDGQFITKQAFWIDKEYIVKFLNH